MKKLLKNIIVCTFVVILATLMSCQEEEFGYTKDEVRAGVYNRNFDKVYGPVNSRQSWDFTQKGSFSRTRAGETQNTPSSYTEEHTVDAQGQKVSTYTYRKKYMVEDLGSTVDFDFNDIVFTVTHVMTVTKNASNEWVSTTKNTTASLVWLCGTIPFSIKVGNTVLGNGKHAGNNGDGNGYNPAGDSDYSDLMNVPVTGYDPDLNNVSVTVWPYEAGLTQNEITNVNSAIGNTISFPSVGDHPYIIVCDVNTPLAPENTNFDISQFTNFRPVLPAGNTTILSEPLSVDWNGNGLKKAVAFNIADNTDYQMSGFDLTEHVGKDLIINVAPTDFSRASFRANDASWKEVYMSYNNYVDDESQDNKNCPFPLFGDVKLPITQAMVDNGLLITGSGYTINKISIDLERQDPVPSADYSHYGTSIAYRPAGGSNTPASADIQDVLMIKNNGNANMTISLIVKGQDWGIEYDKQNVYFSKEPQFTWNAPDALFATQINWERIDTNTYRVYFDIHVRTLDTHLANGCNYIGIMLYNTDTYKAEAICIR